MTFSTTDVPSKTKLQVLKEKYGEYERPARTLDPKPFECPCTCGSRYGYTLQRDQGDYLWTPRPEYEQEREFYANPIRYAPAVVTANGVYTYTIAV